MGELLKQFDGRGDHIKKGGSPLFHGEVAERAPGRRMAPVGYFPPGGGDCAARSQAHGRRPEAARPPSACHLLAISQFIRRATTGGFSPRRGITCPYRLCR